MNYYALETVGKSITFKDRDDVLIDPDTTDVVITDPNGTVHDSIELSPISTGVYELAWDVPSDGVVGAWTVVIKAIKGAYTSITHTYFSVIE